MNRDKVFKDQYAKPFDFKFTSKVAGVFDDMIYRSVPFYEEIQRMTAELTADHAKENTNIYDLGCSTGTTLILLDKTVPADVKFVGIDDSADMLNKCRTKLNEAHFAHPFDLEVADLNTQVSIADASVVVLCLTLQFIRPINRERLIKEIYAGLNKDGVVIIVEKILAEDSSFNRDFINYYYAMKRRHHYSEMEIAQKREALENVLIPYKLSENITMLRDVGFQQFEVFFKWYVQLRRRNCKKIIMIRVGNFFFKYRNWLFIILYLLLFVPSPPLFNRQMFGSDFYMWPQIIGLLTTINGQLLRGLTIGLAYISLFTRP